MAQVSEVVLKYAAKGAKQAQRADDKVRRGLEQTQKTAQKSAGRVNRWMQANRSAIEAISVATLAFLGGLIAASPLARAELGLLRSSFGILADAILAPLLPAFTALSLFVLDAAEAFRDLPNPVRTAVSLILVGAAAIAILLKLGFIAWLAGAIKAMAIWAAVNFGVASSLGAVAIGIGVVVGLAAGFILALFLLHKAAEENNKALAILGSILLGVVLAGITAVLIGLSPLVLIIGVLAAAIAFFAVAWANNWGDIQGKMQAAWDFIAPILEGLGQAIVDVFEIIVGFGASIWDAISPGVEAFIDFAEGVVTSLSEMAANALSIVLDLASTVVDTLSRIPGVDHLLSGARGAVGQLRRGLRQLERRGELALLAPGGDRERRGQAKRSALEQLRDSGGTTSGGGFEIAEPATGPQVVDNSESTEVNIEQINIEGERRDAERIVDELTEKVSRRIKEGSQRR